MDDNSCSITVVSMHSFENGRIGDMDIRNPSVDPCFLLHLNGYLGGFYIYDGNDIYKYSQSNNIVKDKVKINDEWRRQINIAVDQYALKFWI